MFLLLALLLLIFLPSPWNLAAALVSALLGAVEVLYWERRMRSRKVQTGIEELLGSTGEVTAPLDPIGQIMIRGELWEAHSPSPIGSGARVRVVGIEDLRLEVRPAAEGSGGTGITRAAVLAAVVVLALAGCGGDDGGGSSAEDYANGVCSSLNTWADSVQSTVQDLADAGLSITGDDVRTALDDVKDANQTLSEDLEGLGPPETDDGNKAKSDLDSLMTTLQQEVEKVEQAVSSGGGAAAIAGVVTSAVATAANAVDSTYEELRQLDPAGELSDAFKNSDDCKSLEDQLSKSGGG